MSYDCTQLFFSPVDEFFFALQKSQNKYICEFPLYLTDSKNYNNNDGLSLSILPLPSNCIPFEAKLT